MLSVSASTKYSMFEPLDGEHDQCARLPERIVHGSADQETTQMPKKPRTENTGGGSAALQPALGGSDKSPHKIWSGTLSFGLISMPVSLFTAATEERISFNQLHKECHSRIKQQIFCPACDKTILKTDLLKGYEHEKEDRKSTRLNSSHP